MDTESMELLAELQRYRIKESLQAQLEQRFFALGGLAIGVFAVVAVVLVEGVAADAKRQVKDAKDVVATAEADLAALREELSGLSAQYTETLTRAQALLDRSEGVQSESARQIERHSARIEEQGRVFDTMITQFQATSTDLTLGLGTVEALFEALSGDVSEAGTQQYSPELQALRERLTQRAQALERSRSVVSLLRSAAFDKLATVLETAGYNVNRSILTQGVDSNRPVVVEVTPDFPRQLLAEVLKAADSFGIRTVNLLRKNSSYPAMSFYVLGNGVVPNRGVLNALAKISDQQAFAAYIKGLPTREILLNGE